MAEPVDWKGRRAPSGEYRLVFSRRVTLRNGRVLVAENYGLKAFAFWVRTSPR